MPDVELKPQLYKDARPEGVLRSATTSGSARGEPEAKVYELVRVVHRAVRADRLPGTRVPQRASVPDGPLILAPNHASFMDHFFTGAFIRRRIQFMAKSQLFKRRPGSVDLQPRRGVPGAPRLPGRGGVRRARSRSSSAAAPSACTARAAVPAPARSPTRRRPGIGRLALESGRAGRAGGDPRLLPGAQLEATPVPASVTVQYGEPFRFEAVEHVDPRAAAGGRRLHPGPDPHASLRARARRPSRRPATRRRLVQLPLA